jgi:hypothetical protein
MRYETPELVSAGEVSTVVLGAKIDDTNEVNDSFLQLTALDID